MVFKLENKKYFIYLQVKWSYIDKNLMNTYIHKPIKLVNKLSTELKINTQKLVAYLHTSNEQAKNYIKRTILFTIILKGIKFLRSKFNQGDTRFIHWEVQKIFKEIKEDLKNGKTLQVHEMEDLMLLRWEYYPEQFRFSMNLHQNFNSIFEEM